METITPEKIDLIIGCISAFIIFVYIALLSLTFNIFSETLAVETRTYKGVVYDEEGNAYTHKSGTYTGKVWRR